MLITLNLILADTFDFWTGWWDEPQEGQFSNVNNGEPMSQEMRDTIFIQGQPNGATIENCVQVWPGKAGWLDAQCRYKKWVFCYLPEIPVFAARGKIIDHITLIENCTVDSVYGCNCRNAR